MRSDQSFSKRGLGFMVTGIILRIASVRSSKFPRIMGKLPQENTDGLEPWNQLQLILLYELTSMIEKGAQGKKGKMQPPYFQKKLFWLKSCLRKNFHFFPPVPLCRSLHDWGKRHWVCHNFGTAKSQHSRVLVLAMSFGAFCLHPMGHTFKFL